MAEEAGADRTERRAVYSILNYTSLLFVFPAASLVNYAGVSLDNGSHTKTVLLLFAMFLFLILEIVTSEYWLQIEFFGPKTSPRPTKERALKIAVVDLVRIFFLSAFYICVLKTLGAPVQGAADKLLKTTFSLFGLFLISNFIWNRFVTPEHKMLVTQYLNSIDHSSEPGQYFRGFVNFLYWLEWLLFTFLFPSAAILMILFGMATLDESWFLIVRTYFNIELILSLLGVQIVAKLVQSWLFSHVAHSLLTRVPDGKGLP
jgi:hypothetical protein